MLSEYLLYHTSIPSDYKYIDFLKSEFYIGNQKPWAPQNIGKKVIVNDYMDYLNLIEVVKEEDKHLRIQCSKLKLNFNSATEDILRFAELPQYGYYVSDNLRRAIQSNGFTGISFREVDEFDSRISVV